MGVRTILVGMAKTSCQSYKTRTKNPFVFKDTDFDNTCLLPFILFTLQLKMPLPNPDDVDDLLNNSSDDEDNKMAAEVAAASIRHARQAGVVPPPPPIPTQESDAARRHMILSQLSMTQGSIGGTEFDELERTVRQQFPTQTQGTQSGQNNKKEAKPKAKTLKMVPKGRSSGARGYTEDERMNFLEILERRLPTSGSEWSLVASEHSETYPTMERNVESIKRQYQSLLRRREPTGDPNCPPDVKKAKAIDRLLKAKQRAGDISEENGGPIAALAGMEIQEGNTGMLEDNRIDNVSVGTNVTGAALVQKRSSPKSRGSSTLIETMISFQMMQAQKEEQRREEESRKEEQRRKEEKRKEEQRRQREEEDRREQRRRDERREEMFMSIMTAGLAAFSGGSINPSSFTRGTHLRSREEPDDSDESETPPTKRPKRAKPGGPKEDDNNYKDGGSDRGV